MADESFQEFVLDQLSALPELRANLRVESTITRFPPLCRCCGIHRIHEMVGGVNTP
jgi:hypothetical protein